MAHRSGAGSVASREMLSTRNATTFRVTIHAIARTVTTHQDEYISSVHSRYREHDVYLTLAKYEIF